MGPVDDSVTTDTKSQSHKVTNMQCPCWIRGLQLVDSWSSRPGEQLSGLPKCVEGSGHKEVSCAGQRAPARAARTELGGVAAQ